MFEVFKHNCAWATTIALMALAEPLAALEVQILPNNPQLGDTISVIVTTEDKESQPTVTLEQKDYPVFAVGDRDRRERTSRYRALLPTSPLNQPGKLTIQVKGDGQAKNIGVWLKNRFFPTQRITLTGKASSSATQLELDRVAAFKELVTADKFWHGSFVRPNTGRISTGFGVRRYYNGVFAQDYYHRGVDYAGGAGSAVMAPAAGYIKLVGREAEGFRVHGNTIGIDHGQGVLSVLLHLQDIYVKEGDFVQAGQTIGTVGSTGASTGSHLHWGLYVHGVSVDPVPWRLSDID
ncbi:M23 family metallopeptidase [Pleurocapsales cyanobacterium LEGE 06147]|nr:M23 family metallopeptidase [Pleurocapsales cyanobacterium LEGE 06147]